MTAPVDDLTGPDLGWGLGTLLRAHRERLAPALGDLPHGARGHETLREVMRGRSSSQLELARRLGIDRSVMTYLIDDLEEAGLVERRSNPADRRLRQVVATPAGEQAVARLCAQVRAAEEELLGSLDPDERAALRNLVHRAAAGVGGPEHDPELCTIVAGPSR